MIMKKIIRCPPVLYAVLLAALAGCDAVKPPPGDADFGITFNINGTRFAVDAGDPLSLVSRRAAWSGSPIMIEGTPADSSASVEYMLMNGSVLYTNPVSVYLDVPFAGLRPQAALRVIIAAENGAEEDYFLRLEAVDRDNLEVTVMD
jgi:hypothetical protein